MYQSAADAVRECLRSLAPFLIEDRHEGSVRERDLVLLSDKADLNDPELTNALKAYFDKSSPKSNRVKYCGVALICFDVAFYPADDAQKVADEMIDEARMEIEKVVENVSNHLTAEKLSAFEIQLLCVPLPSVDAFRTLFRQTLGLSV